jgi:hypothetical protein
MSKIEVNQISSQCGSTLTIGQSGDTVTLAAGATQSGFGRSGSVNWDTTAKTSAFTAVSGNGYFVNTTSGAVTVTLPASPSAGDIVSISDYAGTAATNNITIARNGSNINGATSDITISKNNSGITLVYVDGTQGWKGTETSNLNDIELQPEYIVATGGTVTCCGDYKIHTFTGPGTFCVSCAGNPLGSETVDYLVIAGGGAGGSGIGGGGGAGGLRFSATTYCAPAPSAPRKGPAALSVCAQAYPITVGAGGAFSPSITPTPTTTRGGSSIFSTITSTGGGKGANGQTGGETGATGGSGGGGGYCGSGGAGNTPPVTPVQGFAGGPKHPTCLGDTGGGGGASEVGETGVSGTGGAGGDGLEININGSNTYYAGGGGGINYNSNSPSPTSGAGGNGGGGAGGKGGWASPAPEQAVAGTANTGGGGGGGNEVSNPTPNPNGGPENSQDGANGGSGVVIIRYKFQ